MDKQWSKSETQRFKRSLIYTNLAYALADVSNTYIMNTAENLAILHKTVKQEERQKFARALSDAQRLQYRLKEIASPLYHMEETDQALRDADWLQDLFVLVIDRVGADTDLADKLVQMIKTQFPSQLKLFE